MRIFKKSLKQQKNKVIRKKERIQSIILILKLKVQFNSY